VNASPLARILTAASGAQALRQMRSGCCGVRWNGVDECWAAAFARHGELSDRTVERPRWMTQYRDGLGEVGGIQASRHCRHTEYAVARS
jgi:hypothetical protein